MTFELHVNLTKKIAICDLPLCKVLLEDNCNYPWIFMVPQKSNVSRIMDLTPADQLQLLKELDFVQKMLWEMFQPTQINVAAIGNKTPQLHIHVIARSENDPAWPQTVWDHSIKETYKKDALDKLIHRLRTHLNTFNQNE